VLATLQQVNALKMDFVLPEAQASSIRNGSEVKVATGSSQELVARVIAIEPQVNAGTRNVRIRAVIEDRSARLNPGAFVTVKIENAKGDSAILIPTNAIIPDTRNKKVALYRNGKMKYQVVETGYRGEERAEIVSGLAPGDTLITSGLLFLKPDAPVKLRSIK
jgi:membrane fusion protein, multidrug efflux system